MRLIAESLKSVWRSTFIKRPDGPKSVAPKAKPKTSQRADLYPSPAQPPFGRVTFSSRWSEYKYMVRPDDGKIIVIAGRRARSGLVYPDVAPDPRLTSYTIGEAPNRGVAVFVTDPKSVGELVIHSPDDRDGDVLGVERSGQVVRWITDRAGVRTMNQDNLAPKADLAPGVDTIAHTLFSGQSTAGGYVSNNGGGPLQTLDAPRPGRALMFNAGIRALGNGHTGHARETVQDLSLLSDLVAAKENMIGNAQETGWARYAAAATGRGGVYEHNVAALVSAHGIDGSVFASLSRGTRPDLNFFAAARRSFRVSKVLGLRHSYAAFGFEHGESAVSQRMPRAQYLHELIEYYDYVAAKLRSINGQDFDPFMLLGQLSSWTNGVNGPPTSEIPFAQLDAMDARPGKVFVVGPKYFLTTSDGLHKDNAGYALWGEYVARAQKRAAAGDVTCLRPMSATFSGVNFRVSFSNPADGGVLRINTHPVTDPGSHGVTLRQTGGNSPRIVGLNIAQGGNEIEGVLSEPPTGDEPVLGFAVVGTPQSGAGPTVGPRCCISNSASDVSSLGVPMPDWCVHAEVRLQAA